MTTINGQYKGDLRCFIKHESSSIIETDAPKDNQGKGELFSPTDLLAASLASCMVTIIAIRAKNKTIEIGIPTFHVIKTMNSIPRKVKQLKIEIHLPSTLKSTDRNYLESEAKNCPVALSLSKDLEQVVSFIYDL